ncbi:MAG: transposase [Gemmataceae bacterium]
MERRFRALNKDCSTTRRRFALELLQGCAALGTFLEPFVRSLCCTEQRNARHYVSGLLSDFGKDAESIAYLHDRERQGIEVYRPGRLGPQALVAELAARSAEQLGDADGVLVFDPSSFAKYGTESAGVARRWCGRLGKIDNCQVAVYLGYVSRVDHALVDFRLYLPRSGPTT